MKEDGVLILTPANAFHFNALAAVFTSRDGTLATV